MIADDRRIARPPATAIRILSVAVPNPDREMIVGDLCELFDDRVASGKHANRIWFWIQTFLFVIRFATVRQRPRKHVAQPLSQRLGTSAFSTRTWDMLDFIMRFRQAVRRLMFDWRYALGVVFILAIGIGPASAMLSVVQKVLLQPLSYEQPDRLGLVRLDLGEAKSHAGISHAEITDFRNITGLFAGVQATTRQFEMSLGDDDALIAATATSVTPGLFQMLGVDPLLGRHFAEDDVESVRAILSYGFWQTQFGASPNIIGTSILLNGSPAEVVGVMPPDFALHLGRGSQLSPRVDMWTALRIRDFRNFWAFPTLVRLQDGVTFEQANASLEPFAAGLTEQHPEHYAGTDLRFVVHPLLPDLVRESRPAIRAALTGVTLLLIIALANATALVVARLKARETDFAIRSAIGAGRTALLADVIVESAVLTAGGAIAGSALASAGIATVRSLIPRSVPRWDTISVGWELVAYSAGLAMFGLLMAGLVPAWRVTRGALWQLIRSGSERGRPPTARGRLVLVGTQIATAVVLAFGALQLARSSTHLTSTNLNFDARVLTFRVPLDGQTHSTPAQQASAYQRIRDRLLDLPGVEAVGAISHLPLSNTGPIDAFTANLADSAGMDQPMANYYAVTPGYFESVRITLQQGRHFTNEEDIGAEPVIVVDEMLARTTFPGEDPIGKTLRLGWGLPNSRIIGVVNHARVVDVSQNVRPQVYAPFGLFQWSPLYFTVRTVDNPVLLTSTIRALVGTLGTGRAVSNFLPLSDNVDAATSTIRAVSKLVAVLAASAVLLAAFGLYAVVSYLVHQHRRATAIRSALGASIRQLVWLHMRRSSLVLLIAVPLGVGASLLASPFIETLVIGVDPRDLLSMAGAVTLAILTGLVGTYLPVRRVAKADPVTVLRTE